LPDRKKDHALLSTCTLESKQVPSIDGSLELVKWDPLATFCWVFFLFQVDWTGLLLVGCCFVQSDFCDSSRMFLWLLLHMVCVSRCVR
jgi:hypothetical protein